jgi:uncharacterized membrane protein YvlD (DUF360 family)
MPFTPFIGLSTFTHIVLIFTYRVFNLTPSRPVFINKSYPLKKLLGSFIALGMFSFVFISAVFMLCASAMEKHSSIHFIENHMSFFDGLVDRSNILAANTLQ